MGTITIDTKKLVLAFLAMLLVGFLLQTGSRTEHDERAKQPTTEHTSSATPAASA